MLIKFPSPPTLTELERGKPSKTPLRPVLAMAHRWIYMGLVSLLHLTDAFVGPTSNQHIRNWISASIPSRCHLSPLFRLHSPLPSHISPTLTCRLATENSEARDSADSDALSLALRRLDLTEDQTLVVRERLQKVRKAGAQAAENSENLERALTWLEEKLGQDALQALVVGHPPVLTYDLDAKLKPTITFFNNALSENNADEAQRRRLAGLLSGSPSIVEYSVAKRLAPRLARVREELDVESVDAEMLRAIATKTDARFEEWLDDKRVEHGVDGGASQEWIGEEQDCEQEEGEETGGEGSPALYVVLSNLQSGGNIGSILRSASIFG